MLAVNAIHERSKLRGEVIFFLALLYQRPTENAVLIRCALLVLPLARGGVRFDLIRRNIADGNSVEMSADVVFLRPHDRRHIHIMRPARRDDDAGDKPKAWEHLIDQLKPLGAVRRCVHAADDIRCLHRRRIKSRVAEAEIRRPARNTAAIHRRNDDLPRRIVCRRIIRIQHKFLMRRREFYLKRGEHDRIRHGDDAAFHIHLPILHALFVLFGVKDVDQHKRCHVEEREMCFDHLGERVVLPVLRIPECRDCFLVGIAENGRIRRCRSLCQMNRCRAERDDQPAACRGHGNEARCLFSRIYAMLIFHA